MRGNSKNQARNSSTRASNKKIQPAAKIEPPKVEKGSAITNKNPQKPIKPADQTKVISRVPVKTTSNTTKPINKTSEVRRPQFPRKKQQISGVVSWGYLPANYLVKIFQYTCSSIVEVYVLSRVCSVWRGHMNGQYGELFWNFLKEGREIGGFQQFKGFLQKYIIEKQERMSFQFEKMFIKLFNYGSTKQNIPNKLIDKLELELEVNLNGKKFMQPFKLRTFNFSSYLCAKIQQIKDFKYDFYTPHNMFKDKITVELAFRSKRYKVLHSISKKYVPEQIVDGAIKQKAFNYFLDKNFVFTFFEGDNHFLYIFFEISLLELVSVFRTIIKSKHQQSLDRKIKKLPLYKQLCQDLYQDFVQYVKHQADFQVHFSYHNSLTQIFTHCDTKVYPVEYSKKEAYFELKIDDSFQKVATYKLDNKMGISESIQDLYLLDFVLKDRDRFVVTFSGFIYARQATQKQREQVQNYFEFSENDMKILQSQQPKYKIKFLIIEEQKKSLMKSLKFTLLA